SSTALADATEPEKAVANPSAQLVAGFFHDVLEIVFSNQAADGAGEKSDALKQVLARTIDSSGIGHFILGRYQHPDPSAASTPPAGDPENDFLVLPAPKFLPFAQDQGGANLPANLPTLTVSNATDRPDQTHLVFTELVWPDGHRLPLSW